MYLPLSSVTLLSLVQLPSLLWDYAKPFSLPGVKPDLNRLGYLSPYHDAPPIPGVLADLPRNCGVDRVVLLHRHGSRGPDENDELGFIQDLEAWVERIQDNLQLPERLQFLQHGYKFEVKRDELTTMGRRELLDHGARFAYRYPGFTTDVVVTTDVERVKESAHFFSQGFFSNGVTGIRFRTDCGFEATDPVSWLKPWMKCPNLHPRTRTGPREMANRWVNSYLPHIVKELNKRIPGVGFTDNVVRGVRYACVYEVAAGKRSPWCEVFSKNMFLALEYELDLYEDLQSGHKGGDDPGPFVGAIYVKKLISRLNDGVDDTKKLYLEFAHESTLLFALSAMGLNKDDVALDPAPGRDEVVRPQRKFRTSDQVPFAAEMIWERFTCSGQSGFGEGPQVRLLLNNATFPLRGDICANPNLSERRYGTCALAKFIEGNADNRAVAYPSQRWTDVCGALPAI